MKHEIRTMLACAAALSLTAFAEKPDKWVRYVESTGSAWVDTGITGRPNTKIECQVEWMNIADSAFVASGYYNNNTRFYMCYCENANGNMFVAQRTGTRVLLSEGWESRFEKNRVYNYAATFSATNSAGKSTVEVAVDGISGWSTTFTGLNTERSLYVFANNSANGTVGGKSKSRCYGLKIWQGSEDGGDMTLVRDFQPCMRGGRAGLYDAVSETIFYSITSTDLICDENSEVPDEFIEYVESQGEVAASDGQLPAYIDTGIIGKSGTTIEFKETSLCNDNSEHCVIGARDSSNRFFMWYHASGHAVGLGYGDTYWRPVTTDPTKAGAWNDSNLYPLNYGDTTHARVSFAAGSQTFTAIDDATGTEKVWTSLSIAGDVNTGKNLYLFARNNNGTPDGFSTSRIYSLKIWQNGIPVRDFRPCLKNGVAGLYDDVSKRIFYSLGTPLVFNNIYRESVKPKEVVFVEYIEADGNNTLDTGVPAKSGIRAKGDFMWMGPKHDTTATYLREWSHEKNRYLESTGSPNVFFRQQHAYLASVTPKTGNSLFLVHSIDHYFDSRYGTGKEFYLTSGGSRITPIVEQKYSFDVTLANGSQTYELDGVQVFSTNITGNVDTGDTLHLFSSSYWRHRSMARCYGLEIYQDGNLVRIFKPCICETTNGVFKGMLYDTVTKSIYRPSPDIPLSRTGKILLSGEEKPRCYVDYVETNGKQFIDTGIVGKSGTAAEFKNTSLQVSESEECFLGSYGNTNRNDRIYLWYQGWKYTAGIGYGATYWRPDVSDPTAQASAESPNVYKLNNGDTTHGRVSLANGSQTFYTIDDSTGMERLWSSLSLTGDVNTGRTMYLFAKNDADSGAPKSPANCRFYFLKIWQGDSSGSNMPLMRDYKPVRLTNGLVVLWDFANNEPYLPKSTTAPYNYTTFPVVGPDGERIYTRTRIIIR